MPKKVLTVIEDLFFTVKINDAAKRAGLAAEFVHSHLDAVERAKLQPVLIVIDLNCTKVDVVKLIEELKSAPESKDVEMIGFVSHVQSDLIQRARGAGCGKVLARSAFSRDMGEIFKGYAEQ